MGLDFAFERWCSSLASRYIEDAQEPTLGAFLCERHLEWHWQNFWFHAKSLTQPYEIVWSCR